MYISICKRIALQPLYKCLCCSSGNSGFWGILCTSEQLLFTILDSLSKVEGKTSPRLGGLGSRRDITFSQPTAQVPSTNNTVDKPWVAPSRRNAGNQRLSKNLTRTSETIYHHVRGILNKLTPERFDKLSLELLNVGIDNEKTLRGLIILIFEKAVDEPKYSSLYAQLCERLNTDAPNFGPTDSGKTTFYRLLLGKCQDEFENRSRLTADYGRVNTFTDKEKEKFAIAKWKMLGNIRFIGELGKRCVVHEGILHKCIQQLLEKKKNFALADQVEDLECLCQIMKTVGRRLDCDKAKVWMDQYFERISAIRGSAELPARIKFMLQDVLELRANNWEPRTVAKEVGPQTIGEIRQQVAGTNIRIFSVTSNGLSRDVDGNMVDIFGAPMTGRSIGIGPGVISDNYRPISPHRLSNRSGQWSGNDSRPTLRDTRQTTSIMPSRITSKNTDRISLRPGSSFSTSLKPGSPSMLPKSAQSSSNSVNSREGRSINVTPIFTKPVPVIVKQETKKTKKQIDRNDKNDLDEQSNKIKMLQLTENYWKQTEVDANNLVLQMKSLPVSKTTMVTLLSDIIRQACTNLKESDMKNLVDVLNLMNKEKLISGDVLIKAVSSLLTEVEIKPKVTSMIVEAVGQSLISLYDIGKGLESGKEYPMMLLILKHLAASKGEQWLYEEFMSSKLSLQSLLPQGERTSDRMEAILSEHNLTFLLSMLAIQTKLWSQINSDPEPASLFKWIKANVDSKFHTDEEFTKLLFSIILKYVTSRTTLAEGFDPKTAPSKNLVEEEKALFFKYKDIMLRFLHASYKRQMAALYALQVFCHENKFPKGLLLRMFIELYDLEIIDDDVFLTWKEDINEEYPGKGTALFQVNQWLTWLEQAESESEDDE